MGDSAVPLVSRPDGARPREDKAGPVLGRLWGPTGPAEPRDTKLDRLGPPPSSTPVPRSPSAVQHPPRADLSKCRKHPSIFITSTALGLAACTTTVRHGQHTGTRAHEHTNSAGYMVITTDAPCAGGTTARRQCAKTSTPCHLQIPMLEDKDKKKITTWHVPWTPQAGQHRSTAVCSTTPP